MDNPDARDIVSSGQMVPTGANDPGTAGRKRYDRRLFMKMAAAAAGTVAAAGLLGGLSGAARAGDGSDRSTSARLPGSAIPKYVEPLVILPAYDLDGPEVKVDAARTMQQMLPLKDADGSSTGFGPTTVFAYGGRVVDPATGRTVAFRHTPGPTFLVKKGVPTRVEWINDIAGPHILPVDPTIGWANPNGMATPVMPFKVFPSGYLSAQDPVPIRPHLHGAELPSACEGGPDGWFTRNGTYGPRFVTRHCVYPNSQETAPLWYHDYAPGMARLNLLAGMAGLYLIQDPGDPIAPLLPGGKYWLPLAIQDRSFYASDGSGNNELAFPDAGEAPEVHPYWASEFFGDAIVVNGHTWPYVNVDRGQYRLTILNGCNARFLHLFFDNGMSFVAIGSDGGYLQSPVRERSIHVPPGSRVEILADFSFVAPGTEITMLNDAPAPFPAGAAPDPDTVGQIIKFRVGSATGFVPRGLPALLNPTLAGTGWPALPRGGLKRVVTLNEDLDLQGRSRGLFLNGQVRGAASSETPKNGTTEDWYFVNMTADAQPMHLQLVQFNVVSRQGYDAAKYMADWLKLNQAGLADGVLPFTMTWHMKVLPFEPYLTPGTRTPAEPDEKGWRDLVRAMPGQVTRIRVRFKQQNGDPYLFDPTAGPGYVWHCQIADHGDNEMMRPLIIKK